MPTKRSPEDWGLFLLLSACWASAFAMTKVAVGGLPPSVIIPGRLITGALVLWTVMLVRGERLPSFSNRSAWLAIIGMGTVGTALPFYLITTGQKTIDSSLAALLISGAPLFTAVLAHFWFHDERFTAFKAGGLALGFAGVAVLLGLAMPISLRSSSSLAARSAMRSTASWPASHRVFRPSSSRSVS